MEDLLNATVGVDELLNNQPEGDDNNRDSDEGNEPVFLGLTMTKSQLLALVFAFILRHHLSKTCLQDLLSILCSLIPNCIPKSKYSFYKEFSQPSTKVILHYKCPVCESYLGEDLSLDQVFFCEFCQAHFTA